MEISIVIMAHIKRAESAILLYKELSQMPFSECKIEWDSNNSEWETGKAAWLSHGPSDWAIVIQDDAIVSPNFYNNVQNAIQAVPEQTCISFYTGTVRPYNRKLTAAVQAAKDAGASWLSTDNLLHGVCVAMPTSTIDKVITYVERANPQLVYDNRIGWYFYRQDKKVYYTMPSLCDHDDTLQSLVKHKVGQPRVARIYQPELVKEWNDIVIDICL